MLLTDYLQMLLISKRASELTEFYSNEKIAFNIAIRKMLKSGNESDVQSMLNILRCEGIPIATDTINTLISYSLSKKCYDQAEEIFEAYFGYSLERSMKPNSRTFNILIEGFRSIGSYEKVAFYIRLMKQYDVKLDKYTLSTLIRISKSPENIMSILMNAQKSKNLNTALLRCAIESLGKLNCPGLSLHVGLLGLQGIDSIQNSYISGDSLIFALSKHSEDKYSYHDSNLYDSLFDTNDDVIIITKEHYDGKSYHFIMNDLLMNKNKNGSYKAICGTKGLCALFSSSARTIKCLSSRDDSSTEELKDMLGFVRQVLKRLLKRDQYDVENNGFVDHVDINGRLCDAILRCFITDAADARKLWKDYLLPQAKSQNTYKEIAEKALMALMYVSGYSGRPDIGLEVAKSVASRQFLWNIRPRLAFEYKKGKEEGRFFRTDKMVDTFLSSIVNDGLERSIESELGELLTTNMKKKLPNIRIKFKE
jgi:pentatricopeptide repeat protein